MSFRQSLPFSLVLWLLFMLALQMLFSCTQRINIDVKLMSNDSATKRFDEKIKVNLQKMTGKGAADDPFVYQLELKNNSAANWEGVVLVKIKGEAADPDFLLPGFMYGDDGGSKNPMPNLEKLFPRLRKGEIV